MHASPFWPFLSRGSAPVSGAWAGRTDVLRRPHRRVDRDGTTSPIEASVRTRRSSRPTATSDERRRDRRAADDCRMSRTKTAARSTRSPTPESSPRPRRIEAGCGPANTVTNCGQCGASCDTTHGSPRRAPAGVPVPLQRGLRRLPACAAGHAGCETPLTTTTNCTSCGVACDTTQSTLGATCAATGCTYRDAPPVFATATRRRRRTPTGASALRPGAAKPAPASPSTTTGCADVLRLHHRSVSVYLPPSPSRHALRTPGRRGAVRGLPCADPDAGPNNL